MNMHLRTAIMGFCAALLLGHAALAKDSDIDAVRKANDGFYAALNTMFTGDVEPMLDVWSHADDTTYMGPAGGVQAGWKKVSALWRAQAAMKLGGTIKPTLVRITAVHKLAVVTDVEVGNNVVNGKATAVSIRATNTFRKEDGRWKMIGHHTDLLPYLQK